MSYIQIKTGISAVQVVSVEGSKREFFLTNKNTTSTTYLDANRAKMLGMALIKAAAISGVVAKKDSQ